MSASSSQRTPAFATVRDFAVRIGRAVIAFDPAVIDQAIAEGDRALAAGPILDPTLYRDAGDELQQQLKVLRAFREFRTALEDFRPIEPSS